MISNLEHVMDTTINAITSQYKADMSALQMKFHALYSHCQNLSKELQQKDLKLQLLKEGYRVQQTLIKQQCQLARSTMALVKQLKTRLIMGQQTVVYRSTDHRPEVL